MIEFPATWVWYGFLVLGGLLYVLVGAQLYNSLRHGSRMPVNVLVSAIFLVGVVALTVVAFSLLSNVDWSTTFTIALPSGLSLHF